MGITRHNSALYHVEVKHDARLQARKTAQTMEPRGGRCQNIFQHIDLHGLLLVHHS